MTIFDQQKASKGCGLSGPQNASGEETVGIGGSTSRWGCPPLEHHGIDLHPNPIGSFVLVELALLDLPTTAANTLSAACNVVGRPSLPVCVLSNLNCLPKKQLEWQGGVEEEAKLIITRLKVQSQVDINPIGLKCITA